MPENDSDVGQYQVDAPPTNRSLLSIGMIWWQYLRPCHRLKNVAIDFHWYHSFLLSHLLCYMFNLCISTFITRSVEVSDEHHLLLISDFICNHRRWLLYCASGDVWMVDCCIVHLGMSRWLIVALCIWGCLYGWLLYSIWGCRDGWLLYSSSGVVSMVDCSIAYWVSIVLLFSLYSANNEVHIWYISTIYAYRWFNI